MDFGLELFQRFLEEFLYFDDKDKHFFFLLRKNMHRWIVYKSKYVQVWFHVDFKLHISQFTLVFFFLNKLIINLFTFNEAADQKDWVQTIKKSFPKVIRRSFSIRAEIFHSISGVVMNVESFFTDIASSSLKQINKNKLSPTHPLLLIGWEQWLTDDAGKLQQRGHWTNTHWHQQCTSLNSKVLTSVAPRRAMFGRWELGRPVEQMKLVDWRKFWDIAWVTLGKGGKWDGVTLTSFLRVDGDDLATSTTHKEDPVETFG